MCRHILFITFFLTPEVVKKPFMPYLWRPSRGYWQIINPLGQILQAQSIAGSKLLGKLSRRETLQVSYCEEAKSLQPLASPVSYAYREDILRPVEVI